MRLKIRVFHPNDFYLPNDQQRLLYTTVLKLPHSMQQREYNALALHHIKSVPELRDILPEMVQLNLAFQAFTVDDSYVHNHEHEAIDDHDREHILPHETIGA